MQPLISGGINGMHDEMPCTCVPHGNQNSVVDWDECLAVGRGCNSLPFWLRTEFTSSLMSYPFLFGKKEKAQAQLSPLTQVASYMPEQMGC